MFALTAGVCPPRRRQPRNPKPRFRRDVSAQIDFVRGCPEAHLPSGHLARRVAQFVAGLDVTLLEAQYSALGRHGYRPQSILSVWLYASLIGLHHSTKVARALETDAAFRLLSGGYSISSATLRRFRFRNGVFLDAAFEKTIATGIENGAIDLKDLALDSVRLRAHASTAAVRTVERSQRRLETLGRVDASSLSDADRQTHEEKLRKHLDALQRCKDLGRTNIVMTNDSAALMKLANGAGAPGHRVTVVASGLKTRMAVSVMIDAATNDYGKVEQAVKQLKDVLARCGVPPGTPVQIAADAGYWSEADLAFAEHARSEGTDLLIADGEKSLDDHRRKASRYFPKSLFVIHEDGTATCPADKKMQGPYADKSADRTKWLGDGCPECPLKQKCTKGKTRTLTANLALEKARAAMRARMAEPGARERYGRRIGTVEPVFSVITDAMGYRRVSSRHPQSIRSEILMKLLAYNVGRLIQFEGIPPPPPGKRPLRVLRIEFEI